MAAARQAIVRTGQVAAMPPPLRNRGVIGWIREHLFSSWLNVALTLLRLLLLWWIIPPLLNFLIFEATWSGSDRTACIATRERPRVGACWPFVFERINFFIYGFYPISQRWRVDVFFALLAFGIVWLLAHARAVQAGCGDLFLCSAADPVGGVPARLCAARAFLCHDLALGRHSGHRRRGVGRHRVLRCRSASSWRSAAARKCRWCGCSRSIFIEFVRGVPLITVLFMASVMLPLFVPEAWSPDKLLRALIGVALFASAYMAEVVRAGLQAIPRGQYEGAQALGLGYWKMMGLIILPQALKVTIPNIVNSNIALFKDTTLVFVVGIFDFLRTIEVARIDPKWATPVTSTTGYAFAAIFYFICCWMMSRYARGVERRLATGYKR